LLDTNIISDLIRNPKGKAAKRIAKVAEDSICTSVIVAAELRYGCAKSGSSRLLEAVEELLDEINILPFDVPPTPNTAEFVPNSRPRASRSEAMTS
jgi:tRNA(fMet)-specific endonuclease VapC